jgi:protein TonB
MTDPTNGAKERYLILGLAMLISLWLHILGFALLRYREPLPEPPPPLAPLAIQIELPPPVEAAVPPEPTAQTDRDAESEETTGGKTEETDPAEAEPPDEDVSTAEAADQVIDSMAELAKLTKSPGTGDDKVGLEAAEPIIDLESQAPQFLSYLDQVKNRIHRHWIFPPAARQSRQTGRLRAVFTVSPEGDLLRIIVEESSGHPILDHAALEAVRGAAPFDPFPDHIQLPRLSIRANFDYRIRYVDVD